MGQRPQKSNPSGILCKGYNHLNHRTLADRTDWRNIKKDQRIMILVSKLDTALQSVKTAKFNANVTGRVSWAKVSITLWV